MFCLPMSNMPFHSTTGLSLVKMHSCCNSVGSCNVTVIDDQRKGYSNTMLFAVAGQNHYCCYITLDLSPSSRQSHRATQLIHIALSSESVSSYSQESPVRSGCRWLSFPSSSLTILTSSSCPLATIQNLLCNALLVHSLDMRKPCKPSSFDDW